MKTFFKTLKEGRKSRTIWNVFITGVLPVTIDEPASGFNIATFITLDPTYENMLGFTQTEVDKLLDEIYRDYGMDPATRGETDATSGPCDPVLHYGVASSVRAPVSCIHRANKDAIWRRLVKPAS